MKYERLTNEQLNDFTSRVVVQLEPSLTQQVISFILELSEYRDKIENGTLIELPCKVGDTVYALVHNYKIEEMIVYGFEFNCRGYVLNTNGDKGNIHYHYDLYEKSLNIDWFFTKAEAEKKLKELKEQ